MFIRRLYLLCSLTTDTKFVVTILVLLLCVHYFSMPSAGMKRLRAKEWYDSKKEEVREARGNYYTANVEKCKEASKLAYEKSPERKRNLLRKTYAHYPEKFKEATKKAYASNPDKFKEAY